MRTLIISDLHLGTPKRHDILRRPESRGRLLRAAARADRLVLLGDTVELLEARPQSALAVARPFLERLGSTMAGREIVVVAGNHDRPLVEPWLEQRAIRDNRPLALEENVPHEASPPLAALLEMLGRATPRVAYPGVWLRPDVYATHGHYLDAHITLPPLLAAALPEVARSMGALPAGGVEPGDYERALISAYGAIRARASARFEKPSRSSGGRLAETFRAALGTPAENGPAIGLGLIAFKLLGGGIAAMGEVVSRLGIGADHVLFGHIHRAGPLGRDDPADWVAANGSRLHNPGSWTHSPLMAGRRRVANAYWPGSCIEVNGDSPPRLARLL